MVHYYQSFLLCVKNLSSIVTFSPLSVRKVYGQVLVFYLLKSLHQTSQTTPGSAESGILVQVNCVHCLGAATDRLPGTRSGHNICLTTYLYIKTCFAGK